MPAPAEKTGRLLIAGVGYPFLHDWSVGPRVAAEMMRREWPANVTVDDWSFSPLDAVWKLKSADPPYQRVVFFGSIERGRPPGTVVRRFWDRSELGTPEEVQARVGEAATGVIGLENTVQICGIFEALPDEVVLIEIEPEIEQWGDGYSAAVEASLPVLVGYIEEEAAAASQVAATVHRESQ